MATIMLEIPANQQAGLRLNKNIGELKMKFKNIFWGLILILAGSFLICDKALNLHFFSIDILWPLFVLLPGLSFEISYFVTKKNPGTLVPGGILTIIGLLFFFESSTNWAYSAYTWPIYIFAVSIGLFQSYIFSDGKKIGTLFSSLFLAIISILFFIMMVYGKEAEKYINFSTIIGLLLILCGIAALIKSFIKK